MTDEGGKIGGGGGSGGGGCGDEPDQRFPAVMMACGGERLRR